MQGLKRRITYVCLFEMLAIGISSSFLALMSGAEAGHSLILAILITTLAVVVNFFFNIAFEAWESRQASRERTLKRRIFHAVGFQLGLVVFLIPMISWWFSVTLWEAAVMDLALILFFPVYTLVFAWGFDRIFGLPASAMPQA